MVISELYKKDIKLDRGVVMEKNPFDWNHPDVYQYESKIKLKIPCYDMLYDMTDRLLTVKLPKQADVLIVGAGGGQELVTFGRKHPEWRLTGLDKSVQMLDVARKRLELSGIEADVVEGEVNNLNRERLFNAGTCLLVLHFLKDLKEKREFLRQIADTLEEGGPFFMASMNGDADSESFRWQMQAWKQHVLVNGISEEEWEAAVNAIGESSHPIPSADVEELLREVGFTQITRYFSAYAIDGWCAVKGGGK